MVVIGLGKNLLFKSVLAHCVGGCETMWWGAAHCWGDFSFKFQPNYFWNLLDEEDRLLLKLFGWFWSLAMASLLDFFKFRHLLSALSTDSAGEDVFSAMEDLCWILPNIFWDIYVPNCWVDLSFNLRVNLDFFLFWFCKLQNRPKVFGCNLKSIDCSRFHSNNARFDEKKKSGINLALKLKSTHHLGT